MICLVFSCVCFFHKIIKFYEDIYSAWISRTSAGLCFSQIDIILSHKNTIEMSPVYSNVNLCINYDDGHIIAMAIVMIVMLRIMVIMILIIAKVMIIKSMIIKMIMMFTMMITIWLNTEITLSYPLQYAKRLLT